MRPVVPPDAPRVDQTQKRLVHERCRLERVFPSLSPHVAARETAQFPFDKRQNLVERPLVAVRPCV
jgi:hypothetical protein